MIVAGLQKTTLLDYPGRVACVVFLTGCNFACPFCHNPDLARGLYPQHMTLEQLKSFLIPRRQLLDGVVVSGGEPTLSAGLGGLCRMIRELNMAVKLDTNGSRPDVLAELIARHLIDFIAMDIKTTAERYPQLLARTNGHGQIREHIQQSIQLIMESDLAYEFRTTCVRPFVDEQNIVTIAQNIQGARNYVLQPFRAVSMLQPDYFSISDPGFAPDQMQRLCALAAPWVQVCRVRE